LDRPSAPAADEPWDGQWTLSITHLTPYGADVRATTRECQARDGAVCPRDTGHSTRQEVFEGAGNITGTVVLNGTALINIGHTCGWRDFGNCGHAGIAMSLTLEPVQPTARLDLLHTFDGNWSALSYTAHGATILDEETVYYP
jgi:hypothetical protein